MYRKVHGRLFQRAKRKVPNKYLSMLLEKQKKNIEKECFWDIANYEPAFFQLEGGGAFRGRPGLVG